MAIDFLSPIDYNGVPSIAFAVPIASSDPTGYTGGIYYNTTTNELRIYDPTRNDNAGAWVPLGEQGAGGPPSGDAGGDLSGTYPNPQIAPGVIVNNDVNDFANIAQSKIANLTTDLAGKAATTTTITAGAGLTGGGSLAANRAINVGAGAGITVNADSIQIDRSVVDTWYDANGAADAAVAAHEGAADPHTQYHTNSRGDARYYTKSQVDSAVSARVAKSGDTMTGNLAMSGQKITALQGLGAGTFSDNDAAPIWYVDQHAVGLKPKEAVRVLSREAPITLSGPQTIDGVPVVAGDRVLVAWQHNGATTVGAAVDNGIYVVNAGAWTRAADADQEGEIDQGSFIFVQEGDVWGGTGFVALVRDADLPWTPNVDDSYYMQLHNRPELTIGDGLVQTGKRVDVVSSAGSGLTVSEDDIVVDRSTTDTWYDAAGTAATLVGNHESAGDPHTQYHTNARGDARYYTKSQMDSSLAGKANTTTSILAGNGLTGGGSLAANRTINVVGGPTLSVTADQVDVVSAPKWTSARSITLTGDVTGTVGSVDGSSNISIATTITGGSNLVNQYAADVGAGTNVAVNHNLGTRDVTVEVYRSTTPWDSVVVDTERTTTNQITLRFASAVSAGQYRVVVQGK